MRESVRVLWEEGEGGGGGREPGGGDVGEVGEARSLSGLTMRKPPNDWERERSPLMVWDLCAVSSECVRMKAAGAVCANRRRGQSWMSASQASM